MADGFFDFIIIIHNLKLYNPLKSLLIYTRINNKVKAMHVNNFT